MKLLSESTEIEKVEMVGGKGSHLQKLVSWGAPVPPFFILTTESFKSYRTTGKFPLVLEKRFNDFFNSHPLIALRSSMISEDDVDSSFAGLFETLLDVTRDNWKQSLIKIYDSVNSERVTEYIRRKNLTVDLQMAVVAQRLIQVEKSGVLFTRSPVEPTGAIAIDAAFGMGEGVVSGFSDVDHYQYTRTQDLILFRGQNESPVLNDLEIKTLIELSLKLEKKIATPSDLEWGFKDTELFIFQIRPITRTFPPLTYFVDTNLSESYPGTVSPFSAAFVKKAYENVFTESAAIMGARGQKLESLKYHYSKLISSVDGHLYYNLEHYYAILRALPGGEKNIDNWHKMIGGKVDELAIPYHATTSNGVEILTTVVSMLKLSFFRKKYFGSFLTNLEVLKKEIEDHSKSLKTSKASMVFLDELINRPLGFGIAVINDIFIMIGLGFLTKALKKKGIEEERVIDLLKTSDGVDSVKPLEHFNSLVGDLSEEFIKKFGECDLSLGFEPYKNIFNKLTSQGFEKEVNKIKHFLDIYGDRSFEELKIESLPMKNDSILLNQLLQWAKKNPTISKALNREELKLKLSWIERKVMNFTRSSIATREASRLWRGKYYHLIRHLILNLSEQLKSEDESWRQFSILDFFSINHHEWKKFAENKIQKEEIQTQIIKRRGWQNKRRHYPEIIPWVETDPLPELNSMITTGALEGQGVSPGITDGIALVLESPNEALVSELKNFILVTKNTDPAWVYIMSRSQGLISEKGSLLSHTAIIGRELNIPTIVGVKLATQKIKTGMKIKIDATKGTIEIL